jgi:hypothetical protein
VENVGAFLPGAVLSCLVRETCRAIFLRQLMCIVVWPLKLFFQTNSAENSYSPSVVSCHQLLDLKRMLRSKSPGRSTYPPISGDVGTLLTLSLFLSFFFFFFCGTGA